MIIGFFKSRNNYQPAIVIFTAAMLFVDILIRPPLLKSSSFSLPVFTFLFETVIKLPLLSVFLGFILFLGNSFLFNSVITSNNLMGKRTYIPALAFVLIMGVFRNVLIFSDIQVMILLLLWMIRLLFRIYDKHEPYKEIFNIGILLAVLSLLNLPSILLWLFILFVFILFQMISWREWIILPAAVIITYIYVLSAYFLTDRFLMFTAFLGKLKNMTEIVLHFSAMKWGLISGILVIVLPAIVFTLNGMERNVVMVRKKLILFIYLFLFSVGLFILNNGSDQTMALTALPSAVFLADFLQITKKKFWREFTFLFLLVLIIYSRWIV